MSIFSKLKDYLSSINLRKQTQNHNVSKQMVDDFAKTQAESETERTAPLTEMVDYHKNNPSSPYKLSPEKIEKINKKIDSSRIRLILYELSTLPPPPYDYVLEEMVENKNDNKTTREETREL